MEIFEPLEHKTCNGKKCYDKKGAMTVKNKRYKESHQYLRIYPCEFCGMWHLTHHSFEKRYGQK